MIKTSSIATMVGLLGGFAATIAGDKDFWKTKAQNTIKIQHQNEITSEKTLNTKRQIHTKIK